MTLRIGSRGSDLALVQSRYIQSRINQLPSAPDTEIEIIKTSGDRIQDVALSAIGESTDERKGFFTKELEEALLSGHVDLAVHSYKDLPSAEVPGLCIAAIPQREAPGDALIFPRSKRFRQEAPYIAPGSHVGTASVRRIAQLAELWPDLKTIPIRGNLPTRLRKLLEGKTPRLADPEGKSDPLDAIMLAEAGLRRLREAGVFDSGPAAGLLDNLEIRALPADRFVAAPAQGALAIQCRTDDTKTRQILAALHHNGDAASIAAERLVLSGLEGGCHLPLGAHCNFEESSYKFSVFLGSEAANNRKKRSYRLERRAQDPDILARHVLNEIQQGASLVLTGREDRIAQIMQSIQRTENDAPSLQTLPLLSVHRTEPDARQESGLQEWLQQPAATQDRQKSNLLAAFSVPGVEALAALFAERSVLLPNHTIWGITAQRTEEAVSRLFPNSTIGFRSEDGTGDSLARAILKQRQNIHTHILGISAERGRPEFYDRLRENDFRVTRLDLYRTDVCPVATDDLLKLKKDACILHGSPSAADAFLNACRQASLSEASIASFRHCAIGPTTSAHLQKQNLVVYALATRPDYEAFIEELS